MLSELLVSLLLWPLVACLPQGGGGGVPAPTVNNLTMYGTGCPLSGGALAQQTRNDTPVFLFSEWNLAVPASEGSSSDSDGSASKWCNEDISLGNSPVGM